MPDRAINTRNATGFLLILLPAALIMSALFVAWPLILGVTVLIAGGNIWQNYEWMKTARSIEPVFQQLIVQNRGEITPIDLSVKANISGNTAKRYLVTKADEFGTGSRQYADRGQVFYFISVSTLGDIFDDSEREDVAAIMPATAPVVSAPVILQQPVPVELPAVEAVEIAPTHVAVSTLSPSPETPVVRSLSTEATSIPLPQPEPPVVQRPTSDLSNLARLLDEQSVSTPITTVAPEAVTETSSTPPIDKPLVTILQSDLAKRLDVHSSTIYKRRSEPNFTDWTRNRDPDGLAWSYLEASKEYYRVDT